ncbi:MAG: hypothetical protein K2Y51_23480 [Gammaproteobacteria bacterium]|jgi:hypothetical protein|nr:hypothetical protein [Gammaproteobacteria bacterium]
MRLPLTYLDGAVVEEVPLDLWRETFEAVGWPDTLLAKRKTLEHSDVLDALHKDELSSGLLLALETLHSLGTEAGREAIASTMSERRVPVDALHTDIGAREFALRLYLGQLADASLADVFARAQTHMQEGGRHWRYNEFLGKESRPLTKLEERKTALLRKVLNHCLESDLGDHVQVEAFEDEGVYVFSVLRSHRTKKPLAVVPGNTARATIAFRPVHGDVIRYEAFVGRLRIAARAASMIEFYRRTFGQILFDDEGFFTGEPVCNLGALQTRGRAALDEHDVLGIGRVRMTECLWERGDRNLIHLRSPDCFRAIQDLGLALNEGELLQAKLKVDIIGASTRPVIVNVRVPSRIEITQRQHEGILEELLQSIGIRNVPVRSPTPFLWSRGFIN